jgi:hypothetical protein
MGKYHHDDSVLHKAGLSGIQGQGGISRILLSDNVHVDNVEWPLYVI